MPDNKIQNFKKFKKNLPINSFLELNQHKEQLDSFLERLDEIGNRTLLEIDALKLNIQNTYRYIDREINALKSRDPIIVERVIEKLDRGSPTLEEILAHIPTLEEIVASIPPPAEPKPGKPGLAGKTPKKGIDYFTEAEKQALLAELLGQIPKMTSEEWKALGKALKIQEQWFSARHILGLEEVILNLLPPEKSKKVKLGGGGGGGGGGVTLATPSGTVDGSNTSFTIAGQPKWIIVDGINKFENVHYTYSVGTITITDGAPPVQFIRSIH
jgi:hypothetical protein